MIVEGHDWEVEVDTSAPPSDVHPMLLEHTCRHHAQHSKYATGTGRGPLTAASHELVVDEIRVRFDGWGLDDVWVGAARTPQTTIKVVASNTRPHEIGLAQITDPSRYLRGQRAFMRN